MVVKRKGSAAPSLAFKRNNALHDRPCERACVAYTILALLHWKIFLFIVWGQKRHHLGVALCSAFEVGIASGTKCSSL